MKVIVNVSGFYGGTWYDEKREPQVMPDAIARAFLPPHGHQLSLPVPIAQAPAEEHKLAARKRAG
jgi:hypothetical protein